MSCMKESSIKEPSFKDPSMLRQNLTQLVQEIDDNPQDFSRIIESMVSGYNDVKYRLEQARMKVIGSYDEEWDVEIIDKNDHATKVKYGKSKSCA